MSNADLYARKLLESVQAMITTALQPFDEQARRTAALLAHTRDEIGRDRMEDHALEAKLAAHGGDVSKLEDRVHALAKRVEQLESGHTGRITERKGPPPGVPFAGAYSPDPTTRQIERMIIERDEQRRQIEHARALLSHERKEHEQIVNKLAQQLEAHTATILDQRRRLENAQEGFNRATGEAAELKEKIRFREMTVSPREDDLERKLREAIHEERQRCETITACDATILELRHELALRMTERDEARERSKAHSATIAEFANKCRALEDHAQRRENLDAGRIERLAQLEGQLQHLIPLQQLALDAEQLARKLETRPKSGDTVLIDAVGAFLADLDDYKKAIGTLPDPDDCQAGTCDCPSGPNYEIKHKPGCTVDDIPF